MKKNVNGKHIDKKGMGDRKAVRGKGAQPGGCESRECRREGRSGGRGLASSRRFPHHALGTSGGLNLEGETVATPPSSGSDRSVVVGVLGLGTCCCGVPLALLCLPSHATTHCLRRLDEWRREGGLGGERG